MSALKEFGSARGHPHRQGVPFARPNALFNLSKLSVWWLRLGISNRAGPSSLYQSCQDFIIAARGYYVLMCG
ncbi:MAG: hypothetical protein WB822_09745 [Rhodoplanes sp.]